MMKSKLYSLIIMFSIIISLSGVYATWEYGRGKANDDSLDVSISVMEFIYAPEDMPEGEVSLLQRLLDILNKRYTTDIVKDSLDYLINETIQVYWGGNIYADPYVGSMDANFKTQIDELFEDVIIENGVSFILKNQDLNGDGYREIALYSTSDPLDCVQEFDGTVCVYVSVFTPVVDENKNVVGYNLALESLRGYCSEVYYGQGDTTPSFSTDEWKDDLGYYHWYDQTWYRIPEDAMSIDGTKPLRYDYASYNQAYEYMPWNWGTIIPYGNNLGYCLMNKIPFIN